MKRLSYAACAALMAQAFAVQSMGDPRWITIANQACAYRSRGKGRGTPSRRYGNACNTQPHQGRQERMRRLVGGFRGDKAVMVAKLQPVLRRAA